MLELDVVQLDQVRTPPALGGILRQIQAAEVEDILTDLTGAAGQVVGHTAEAFPAVAALAPPTDPVPSRCRSPGSSRRGPFSLTASLGHGPGGTDVTPGTWSAFFSVAYHGLFAMTVLTIGLDFGASMPARGIFDPS